MALFSYNIEKHVLGGLIKNPEVFPDVDAFISEKDFYSEVHATIFSCVKSIIIGGAKIDKVILAQRIKNLGISFKDDINIFDYIDSISFTQISAKATIDAGKELSCLRVKRELDKMADKIKECVRGESDKDIHAIVSEIDSIYGNKVSDYFSEENKPKYLLENIIEEIELRGNSERDETGLEVPYPSFNRLFGGLRPKCLYTLVARPGNGKTTILSDIIFKTCSKNNVKALILDTEMPTEDVEFRMFSALSGVPMWYLETGKFRRNAELYKKATDGFKKVKEYLVNKKVQHTSVGDKKIEEICSIVRRWKLLEVGRENQCIVALDFLEVGGDSVGDSWKEYQVMGQKMKTLKRLAKELNCPIIVTVQSNRGAENRRLGDAIDSGVIALSDRIQWFSDFTAFLSQKTREEIAWDGELFGTHMFVPLKTRYQGRDATGHHDLVRRKDPEGREKYYKNYLNFEIKNFNVEEKGTLHDIAESERSQYTPNDPSGRDGELL